MSVNKLLAVFVLVTFFALSIVIRADIFQSAPLGQPRYAAPYQRQENTEVFDQDLYVMTVYRDNPLTTHWFAPYIGASPHFLTNKFNRQLVVYPSFSPVLFIVPYVFLTVTHIGLSYTGLQIFSLLLHLVTIFMVYWLVITFLPKRKLSMLIALLCASVYTFATNTLQSHMDVYWAHQLLQPFYFGTVLLFVKRKGLFKWWESLIVGFVLSIITWTGLVVSLCFATYFLYKYYKLKDKAYLKSAAGLLGGMGIAVGLIASQILFVTAASIPQYISKVFARVQARSFDPSYASSVFETPFRFIWNVLYDAGAYIAIAAAFLIAFWKRWRHTFAWTTIAITLFPLLESIPLLEHDTVYSFGRLKLFIPLILVLALGSYEFLTRIKNKKLGIAALIGLFAVANIIHIFLFLDIYTPKY